MRILVTNDDGLAAEGILALADGARGAGEVRIVAPDRERSACGHSMTMREPLRVRQEDRANYAAWAVSGVPVDCVNVGLSTVWKEGCDLVLSGFNHGPNLGFDTTYSGTVAGAMEGAINGIRSVALSIARLDSETPILFETGTQWVAENIAWLASCELPAKTFLNVNIPNVPFGEIKGVKLVPVAGRVYVDRVEFRVDPWGTPYYWQGGNAILEEPQHGTDLESIRQGFVSVTPLTLDWTNYSALESLAARLPKPASL